MKRTGSTGSTSSASSGGTGGPGGSQAGSGGSNPAQDPAAKINHPGDGQQRPIGVPITFAGQATDPQDGALTGSSLVWTDDKEGMLGTGETPGTTFVSSLEPGKRPMIASAAMSVSSVSVIANALRLRRLAL